MSLQAADRDGLVFRAEHTRAFAQFLHRAHARAGSAEKIGLQDSARRTAQIVRGNFLDEPGDIDVRGTGVRAWSVVAHQAPRCLDGGLIARQRWQKFVERIRTRRLLLKSRQASIPMLIPG